MKKVKKILIITLFAFMLFNIDNFSVEAAQNWGSYSSDAMKNVNGCEYTIKVNNVDRSIYNNKKIILVPDPETKTVGYLNPATGQVESSGSEWASDQGITLGLDHNMYNYIVQDGSINCKGLGFMEDDFGGLMVYDGITLANSDQIHVDTQMIVLGDAITKENKEELIEKLEEKDQGGNVGETEIAGEDVELTCDGILGEAVQDDLNRYLGYIRIAAPILVIVLGMVDFGKAVISGDDKEFSKAVSSISKRLIAAVALFFIPLILSYLINAVSMFADHQINGCSIKGW